ELTPPTKPLYSILMYRAPRPTPFPYTTLFRSHYSDANRERRNVMAQRFRRARAPYSRGVFPVADQRLGRRRPRDDSQLRREIEGQLRVLHLPFSCSRRSQRQKARTNSTKIKITMTNSSAWLCAVCTRSLST